MRTETQRLRKGTGYPLKPSRLAALLDESEHPIDWTLIRSGSGLLFECFFWPPNPNVPHERFYIRSAAFPNEQVGRARSFLEATVFPEFRSWLSGILTQPYNSTVRREEQYFARQLPETV